jgi:hypothetical protein
LQSPEGHVSERVAQGRPAPKRWAAAELVLLLTDHDRFDYEMGLLRLEHL